MALKGKFMKRLEIISNNLDRPDINQREEEFMSFVRSFKSTLMARGVHNDFSLRKVLEEARNGRVDFSGHERDVYDQIKDLLDNPEPSPTPNENVLLGEDRKNDRAA